MVGAYEVTPPLPLTRPLTLPLTYTLTLTIFLPLCYRQQSMQLERQASIAHSVNMLKNDGF